MFLAEPPRTAYDLHFDVAGFTVRVTPFFWLAAVVLGYDLSRGLDGYLGARSPGLFVLLVMWVVAVFLSILIHELGHAFAFRRYGTRASIVLYHFGGLAIPDSMHSFFSRTRYRGNEQIVISLAGPGAQLLLALGIVLAVRLSGFQFRIPVPFLDAWIPPPEGKLFASELLDVMLFFLITPSIMWALLNLLPVFPLDGGQVSRELFMMFFGSEGFRYSLILSIGVAGLGAVFFYGTGNLFAAILFISLGVSSYQLLQMLRFGGGPW